MKNFLGFTGSCLGCLAVALLSATAQPASQGKAAAPPKRPDGQARIATGAISNSAELDVPLSRFVLPHDQKEGRDPFYPNSSRCYAKHTPSNAAPVEVTLTLNGITPGKLVMINGRTFSAGEEGDVKTPAGSAHVRCLEIKVESAIVEMNGARRELRLRQGL